PAIPPVDRDGALALSFAQQRLWFLAQMDERVSAAYHIPGGLRLRGALDRSALVRALDRIVARHEALRTRFVTHEGVASQHIDAADIGFALIEHDLCGPGPDRAAELRWLMAQEAAAPFDLEAGPLVRGRLIALSDEEHVLLVTMHHIVSDGWSLGVMMRELNVLYAAYAAGDEDPLPALAVQYADYAAWQRQWLSGDVLAEQAGWWRDNLSGAPSLLELPLDHPRPVVQDYRGGRIDFALDADLTTGLKGLSRRYGVTLFMTLLAAWSVVLSRLSGQEEVIVGTPVANRRRAEVEPLIGFFVNTLALRLDVSEDPSVGALLQRVKAQSLAAQQHQDLPFEQIVELVRPERSLSHSPVFQAMFAWQNNEQEALALPGLALSSLSSDQRVAKFDLTLDLGEVDGIIAGGLDYAAALFDAATVERHAGYLRRVLEAMVADDAQRVGGIELLSEAERHCLLVEWNATAAVYPADKCVHELFEAQAAERPDAVALVYEEATLSYGALNARANRLAHHLISLGVGPDCLVGLCVERGFDMVVGLLAILKAGGAYVPLDPSYPAERLAYMLGDAAPVAVLTHRRVDGAARAVLQDAASAAGGPALIDMKADASLWADRPAGDPDPAVLGLTPRNLAYVIYTSGSTGQPKGVMNE
ncbi:condensation domain-containing protein, partial [Brucella sp. 22210]|uniref:condensation domain-containing protein n=1 Tax=Brucella sp. 22210 TaxID=3453892 RepID=UPI003F86DA9C